MPLKPQIVQYICKFAFTCQTGGCALQLILNAHVMKSGLPRVVDAGFAIICLTVCASLRF